MRVALSAGVFAWPVLFLLNARVSSVAEALIVVTLGYALSAAIVMWLAPIGAREMRHGMFRMMRLGVLTRSVSFAFLASMVGVREPMALLWTTLLFAAIAGVARALYLAPYSVATEHAAPSTIGKELWIAAAPVIAGVMIASFGAAVAFGLVAALMLLSLLPLFIQEDVYEDYRWNVGRSYAHLFSHRFRSMAALAFARGAESVALFLVWPIAALVLLGGYLPALGAILTLAALVILAVRTLLHVWRIRWPLSHGTVFSLRYVLLGAATTPGGVILASVAAYACAPDHPAFDHAEDSGAYLDEGTILKEMAAAFGKVVMSSALVVLILFFATSAAVSLILVAAIVFAAVATILVRRAEPRAF